MAGPAALMALLMEMFHDGSWRLVGRLNPGGRDGSVSNNVGSDRQIIRFRLDGDCGVVERSRAGIDFEHGVERGIVSVGYEELARLRARVFLPAVLEVRSA